MRTARAAIATVAALAATASFASIPPAYQKYLPPERVQGDVEFLSGGRTREETDAVKRAAQEWPLELVFRESDAGAPRALDNMPVTVTDARGKVVFDGVASGPVMLLNLPKGKYTVTTKWDAWHFSRPVTLGNERERVVFNWEKDPGNG